MSKPRKPKAQPGRDQRLRSAAEAQLARAPGTAREMQAKTPTAIIHELRVHQSELEMQNEELKRARLALEESRDRYLDLYDFAPVGYFTCTRSGRIVEANLTGAALLGVPRAKLVGPGLGSFVASEDRDRWERHLAGVLQSAAPAQGPGEKHSCELKLKREDGSTFHARLESVRLDRPEGRESAGAGGESPVICTALSDITERLRAEEALRESGEFTRRVIESSKDCIKVLDLEGHLLSMSEGGRKLLEIDDLAPYLNTSWIEFWKGHDREAALEAIARARKGDAGSFCGFCETAKGAPKWWEVIVSPIKDAAGNINRLLGVSRDITERRQATEALYLALQESKQRQAEVAALLKGARIVLEHHQFQPAARAIYEACKELIGAAAGYVALLRENSEAVDLLFLDAGGAPCTVDPALPMPLRGLRAEACRTQRVVYENDFRQSSHMQFLPQGHAPLENVLFAPLGLQGRVVGLLGLANKTGGFTANDARLAAAFAELAALALHNSHTLQLLQDSEERFRLVAHSAEDAIVTADASGTVVFWNPAAERIFGYASGEILGQPVIRLGPERLRAAHQQAFAQALTQGTLAFQQRPREMVGCRRDGSEVAVEFSLALWRSGTKPFATAIIRDITKRKQAEQALRRAHDELDLRVQERTAELQQTNQQLRREIEVRRQTEQELTEAELRYRTVADFTHDWEYWENPECVLRYCSPSCERITGYSAQEFMADPRLLQQIVHPDDAGIWQKHREESLNAPGPRVIQFRIRKKDASVRWVEHACQPVLGEDGAFLGIRASNRDITDRKDVELQTQQLREELAHVSRATTAGQLAASLAHELNQPLTAIHCNAETAQQFLATDPPNVAEVREALDDIAHDSERAGGVIQRLSALFNKTGQERSVLQINDIVHETIDLLRSEFVLKGIATQLHLEPTLPAVLGNRIELQQVLLNLVVNAMQAMSESEPGQRRLQIATVRVGPKEIRASISDSGPGIRVEPISRLFEPFFTTKAGGMGMGLAISQSIVEAHGGGLGAVNNPDRGATFHLTLPIHHGEEA